MTGLKLRPASDLRVEFGRNGGEKRWPTQLTANTLIMTTSTAKDAVMSRSRMGTMSTTCTTVTFIDDTTITTTNANRPATPCMRITTTSTVTVVVMWPCRTGTMSTTCTTGADMLRTASTTTSTDAVLQAGSG